jgi:hypothetical protein
MFIRVLVWPAFFPRRAAGDGNVNAFIQRFGWAFILLRWGYYTVVFAFFRDYETLWKPFVPPPFGLSPAQYGPLQSFLAVPFGFLS